MRILLISSLSLLFSIPASAQQPNTTDANLQCVANANSTRETTWRWPKNTRVTVRASQNQFTASELDLIRRAIDNWNRTLQSISVDVQFSFAGESDGITSKDGDITITRGSTYQNQRHLAEIYPVFRSATELSSASITIDKGVKNSEVLTSVITHELGHSLGMQDCAQCRRGTTIMSLYRGRNQNNDTDAPSACDRMVVARGYQN
jgi:predicted Zn-dependent protease